MQPYSPADAAAKPSRRSSDSASSGEGAPSPPHRQRQRGPAKAARTLSGGTPPRRTRGSTTPEPTSLGASAHTRPVGHLVSGALCISGPNGDVPRRTDGPEPEPPAG